MGLTNQAIMRILGFWLFIFQLSQLFATHNRAGEITFEQIGPLTIKATVTTYTMTSSVAADRDSIEVFWGDGTSSIVPRANGWGDPQPNDIKINYYIATHTYSGRATYTISMFDPNRIAGILNVNYPDSANVPFYLETTFSFLNTQFLGDNNSVRLLAPPVDFGCVGQVFRHNPNAYDIDGDSLSYVLIIPLQQKNMIVPDYRYPDQIGTGLDNVFTLDPLTGDIIWNAPKVAGDYNIAFRVNEYRQGILISTTIRDMQILIRDNCQNQNPQIGVIEEICVFAGEKVVTEVAVSDPDPGQKLMLTAYGAPFISTKNKATLPNQGVFLFPPFSATFTWETSCEDVSDQYYQIVFKVTDNGFSDTTGLTNLKTLRIKVIAPPPQGLAAVPSDDHIFLNWNYPYFCSFTDDKYFLGFSVWRRISSETLEQDACSSGMPESGYQKIEFLTDENDAIRYFYRDFGVEKELNYCYRIVPEFSRKTMDGFPYNPVSGRVSNEVCNFIPSNAPLLTKASVSATSETEGIIQVNWLLVPPEVFDTVEFPGPYRLQLKSSTDGNNFSLVDGGDIVTTSYQELGSKTSLEHKQLNTVDHPYHYTISIAYGLNGVQLGSSPGASSVFVKAETGEGNIRLQFEAVVPWQNNSYDIYRKAWNENDFRLIGTSSTNSYSDADVENEKTYCYYVVSHGSYSVFPQLTIINLSQQVCIDAITFIPLCSLELSVTNECENAPEWIPEDQLFNELSWENMDCTERIPDIRGYHIYYGEDPESMVLIANITDPGTNSFSHQGENGLMGCYLITAVDIKGNEGLLSKVVCMENCPVYELPNVFTPNGDNVHDTFVPRFNRHIQTFKIRIYNQWGQLIFETDDPGIHWDGTNLNGKALASGVYFYVCRLTAGKQIPDRQFTGFIHLFR